MTQEIIEISNTKENEVNRTKLVIAFNGEKKEILLEGKGSIKAAVAEV